MKFESYKKYLSPALAKATDLIMESGKGCYMTDINGDKYLDFVQGIAVNALGHCHPKVVEAVIGQTKKLMNASFNLVNFPTTLELSRRLSEVTPGNLNSVFFSNGGAEATDGALKLAKAYTKRPAIIAFKGSFHGRTIGATTVTASNSKYRKYYEPMMGGVYFATYPSKDLCPKGFDEKQRTEYCLDELDSLFKYIIAPEMVAAIIMEPVQGEGGYVVPAKEFVQGVRDMCTKYGILLIFDEIQSGYGRTGKMFAGENFDVVPDIMTVGKAIAGGLPMSAVISTEEIMSEWHAGMHGTTFGGNPVCAAAALAVLDEYKETNILENVHQMGAYLKEKLEALKGKYSCISDIRGIGLMVAIEFSHEDGTPAGDVFAEVRDECFKNKLLTLACGVYGNGLRFATPLNVTKKEIDEGIEIIDKVLNKVWK
ncbi:aspartate aminotransferase family protein [Clostridium tyrobutyricum]|uniref:aspartate aminotransferase family protein n=1 Tax=Clostridium tyrobutyricum TaxID=1519 RepID=UPI001C3927FD|nr:aspartate aminotransferase family protein [Clostridium tyrobutyricum]MBV4415380.1 aspartate aminotransferase family protein [Clostridium tyrobutyricum]